MRDLGYIVITMMVLICLAGGLRRFLAGFFILVFATIVFLLGAFGVWVFHSM